MLSCCALLYSAPRNKSLEVLYAMRMSNRTHAFAQLSRHENLSFVMHMSAHAFFYAMIPILVPCALGVALCLLYVFSFPDEIPGHGSCH